MDEHGESRRIQRRQGRAGHDSRARSAREARVTVLYFADTRFPIERANGAADDGDVPRAGAARPRRHAGGPAGQARCRAIRSRIYGLPPARRTCKIHSVPGWTQRHARRLRFLLAAVRMATAGWMRCVSRVTWAWRRGCCSCPGPGGPRVVYESHGLAVTVAEEMPALLGRTDRVAAATQTRAARSPRAAGLAAGPSAYLTLTQALADELTSRYGATAGSSSCRMAPARSTICRRLRPAAFIAGYAGHLYPWKGVDVFVRALATRPACTA